MATRSFADVEYVFTAAGLVTGNASCYLSRGAQCCLLFGQRSEHLDLSDIEHHQEIANSDLTRKLLGDTFVILPIHNTHAKVKWGPTFEPLVALIATNEMDRACYAALSQAKNLPVTLVKDGEVLHRDGFEIFNNCGIPEKYIIGCAECQASSDIPNTCSIVKTLGSTAEVPDLGIEDFMEEVPYWKSRIGKFVAIGPSYTDNEHIAAGQRGIHAHSFKYVNRTIDHRKGMAIDRRRVATFRKEICSQCLIKEPCWAERPPRYCTHYHPETLKELSLEIVRNVQCNFTGPQLRVLLANSGPLDKRYGRYKGVFTLVNTGYPDHDVKFSIQRKTRPGDALQITSNYKVALEWLNKYLVNPEILEKPKPMLATEKAVLFELLERRYSPTYNNGWRRTAYPVRYVCKKGNGPFYVKFSWDSAGRYELPWSLRAESLIDVYRNYRRFRRTSGTRVPQKYAVTRPTSY